MKTIVILALATVSACAGSRSEVDASVLFDAPPPPLDASGGCPLVVNEVAAAGAPSDWFELVNVSATPIDLAGYRFIDEVDDPTQAEALTPAILAPGARMVQEVNDAANGFGLGTDDAVWIYAVGATVACTGVDWAAGQSPAGGSYSRVPDRTGSFRTTTPDTRGVPN